MRRGGSFCGFCDLFGGQFCRRAERGVADESCFDGRAHYRDVEESKEVLRDAIVAARSRMNEAYGKTFTSVSVFIICEVGFL